MSFTENLRKIITKAKGTLKFQRFTGGEQRAALRAPLLHSSGSIRRILFAVAFSCASFRSSGKSAWDFHSLLRSLPSCARLSRARTMSLHRRLIPFRVRVPFHLSKKKNSACSTLFFIWRRTWDFHSLLRSLPSCARLSRARTMSLHRRLIPFRVRVPSHLSKKKNSACSTLFFIWRRTWDSNPRGCYTLLAFQASSLATRSILRIAFIYLL